MSLCRRYESLFSEARAQDVSRFLHHWYGITIINSIFLLELIVFYEQASSRTLTEGLFFVNCKQKNALPALTLVRSTYPACKLGSLPIHFVYATVVIIMRNINRFRLRAHTLKVEAAAWLEDGSCVCDQRPGEDEHVQNEVHAPLICRDHRVCELRKHFPFYLHLFLRTFQQPNPFCCNRSTTNLFMISFLGRTIDFFFFFLSLWIYLWLAETSQQPISQTANLAEGHPPL